MQDTLSSAAMASFQCPTLDDLDEASMHGTSNGGASNLETIDTPMCRPKEYFLEISCWSQIIPWHGEHTHTGSSWDRKQNILGMDAIEFLTRSVCFNRPQKVNLWQARDLPFLLNLEPCISRSRRNSETTLVDKVWLEIEKWNCNTVCFQLLPSLKLT